jgi:dihydroorotate dehydrogenase|tara:strand:+ start:4775 stop:5818 length:1044 start_codon:yes stop_codon:yes gene_type:complete
MNFYKKIRNIAFLTEPEKAHKLAISALKLGIHPPSEYDSKLLQQEILDIKFKNPIGLAAGFDKNGEVPNQILQSGFGFTEVGTVTPKKQIGNKQPRVFRLEEDLAIINRLGFNNDGMDDVYSRLSRIQKKGIVGINIGANKDSKDKINDYLIGIQKFYKIADYLTINISSPNTPGLRDLQTGDNINELLQSIGAIKKESVKTPIVIKLAPELSKKELENIINKSIENNIDGLILTNTTTKKNNLKNTKFKEELGGLSGHPLMSQSTKMLKDAYIISEGKIPLIGVGGISSADDILKKIKCGASLVQLYTSLVYEGPNLISNLKRNLIKKMEIEGVHSIQEIIGTEVK